MNDVRKMIFGAILGLFLFVGLMIGIVYVSSCGASLACPQAPLKGTPIPTLIPAHAQAQMVEGTEFNKCLVNAVDLIGAWVSAGTPNTDPFPFTDANGAACEGTYAKDIQPLLVENSLWKTGTIGCVSCHNANLNERSGGLDLTTYDALLLGSQRQAGSASKGKDILGNGDWKNSALYNVLANQALVVEGHSMDAPVSVLILYAGQKVAPVIATTPTP